MGLSNNGTRQKLTIQSTALVSLLGTPTDTLKPNLPPRAALQYDRTRIHYTDQLTATVANSQLALTQ